MRTCLLHVRTFQSDGRYQFYADKQDGDNIQKPRYNTRYLLLTLIKCELIILRAKQRLAEDEDLEGEQCQENRPAEIALTKKEANRKASQKHYLKYKEEIKAKQKQYRLQNQEYNRERKKRYRVSNKEAIRAQQIEYYSENRDLIKTIHRNYRTNQQNKEKMKFSQKLYNIENKEAVNAKLRKYRFKKRKPKEYRS